MKRSKFKAPLFTCLLFLTFTSCKKEGINDVNIAENNSDITQNYGDFTVIRKKDSTLVIFNKKTSPKMNYSGYTSGSDPQYIFRPENYIFDNVAMDGCDASIPENEIFFKFSVRDNNGRVIGHSLYNNGTFVQDDFSGTPTIFYNIKGQSSTKKLEKYLDCWCANDPVETVKEL